MPFPTTSGIEATRLNAWYELRIDYMFETNSGRENAGLVLHVDNETMLAGDIIDEYRAASIEVNMRRQEESQWTLWSATRRGPYISTTVESGTNDFQEASDGGESWTNDPWGERVIRSTYPNTENPGGEWNHGEAIMMGDSLGIFTLNGQVRVRGWDFENRADRSDSDPNNRVPWPKGGIGVQAEAFGIYYKNWEVRSLIGCTDSTAANYGSWYVKDSVPSTCLYAGCKDDKYEEYSPDADVHDSTLCLTMSLNKGVYGKLPSKSVLSSANKTLFVSEPGGHSLRIAD